MFTYNLGESKGFLTLTTRGDHTMAVEVSPASREIEAEVAGFLSGNQKRYERLVIANWKFGLIIPLFPMLFGLAMVYTALRDTLALVRGRLEV